MKPEKILCVETAIADRALGATGFIPIERVDTAALLLSDNLWFAPRRLVEEREDFRQIIPYVMLRHGDSVNLYERTPKGGERRLHGLLSIGFGGHVRLPDAVLAGSCLDVAATLLRATHRELDEEVRYASVDDRRIVGVIFDDADAVSRVHLGIAEMWTLVEPFVARAEAAVRECRFVSISDLEQHADRMERWSQLCTMFLTGVLERCKS